MNPFFIKSQPGNIFCLYHGPANGMEAKGNILFVPPFAEELNRSRHMINRQARRFAAAGYGVLILDLFGTGDSEGTFGQATIELWRQDIMAAADWLRDRNKGPLILWAMRSGALLTMDLFEHRPELCQAVIFWSPVTSGKKFMNQYLRVKLAAEITQTAGQKLTMNDLWACLDEGQSLEIAGYELSPALARGFSGLSLDKAISFPLSVKWVETAIGENPVLSPASRKVIDFWTEQGTAVSAQAVRDVAFWTLQEPEWANNYIDQTMTFVVK